MTPAVSVIIPTYNEAENLPVLLERLSLALDGIDHEIIVVDDDSPDGTWQLAQAAGREGPVRLIRRIGRRGLSSAVLEGMAAAEGAALAVLDADLQHDETILPRLVQVVLDDEADIAVGSRGAPGGSYGSFGAVRRLISFTGALLARVALGVKVTDPMSGYFVVSRRRFDQIERDVNPRGFKVLLDMLVNGDRPRVAEVGYRFRARRRGETKLDGSVVVAFLHALVEMAMGRLAASRFIRYAAVAITAISMRLSVASLLTISGLPAVDLLAFEVAIVVEFVVHHRFTFAPQGGGSGTAGRLIRFHFVAIHAALAFAGLGLAVERAIASPRPASVTALTIGLAGLGVVGLIVAGFVLNRSLVWPTSPGPTPGPATSGVDAELQTRRPMTRSMRSEISTTARR